MKYDLAATGGTFDIIHLGHRALLSRAFAVSRHVIIGLTGDPLAARRGKTPQNSYRQRLYSLDAELRADFSGRYTITRLDDDFGPAALEDGVQALIVSQETSPQGDVLNRMRRAGGRRPVDIITVPMVAAYDGRRISTTRIRNSEIDDAGVMARE